MAEPGGSDAEPDLYVVDASVWHRLPHQPTIRQALAARATAGSICLTPPVILEIGFSAASPNDWERAMGQVAAFTELPFRPQTGPAAARLQRLLWESGLVRAMGVFDTLTAAVALDHGATVLHYDRDFELLASVCPEFRQEWIVPAGSVD